MAVRSPGGRAGSGVRAGYAGGRGGSYIGGGNGARARRGAGRRVGAPSTYRTYTTRDDLRQRDEPRDDHGPDSVSVRDADFLTLCYAIGYAVTLGRTIGYAIPIRLTLTLARVGRPSRSTCGVAPDLLSYSGTTPDWLI